MSAGVEAVVDVGAGTGAYAGVVNATVVVENVAAASVAAPVCAADHAVAKETVSAGSGAKSVCA